jgi:F0F1-type ATP synthase membrane subunit c/vacuolar-type H+-ATPase subunit K
MYQDIEKDIAAGVLGATAITAGAVALPLGAAAIAASCIAGGAVAHTVSAIARFAYQRNDDNSTTFFGFRCEHLEPYEGPALDGSGLSKK